LLDLVIHVVCWCERAPRTRRVCCHVCIAVT
jgi:hypothetical protein